MESMNDVTERNLGDGWASYVADENDGWKGKTEYAWLPDGIGMGWHILEWA